MINTNYTYILSTLRAQSWMVGRDSRSNFDGLTGTDYALYQNMSMTDELGASSPNSIKTLFRHNKPEATFGNYGMDFFYLSSPIDSSSHRLDTAFSLTEVVARDFRASLDAAGNTNDLYLYNMALGGLGNNQSSALDLNANSEEYLKFQVDKLAQLILELQQAGEQPYVIFLNCQGKSSETDSAAHADRVMDINYYWQQRMGSVAPIIEFPNVWSSNIQDEHDVYVHNNYNVSYCGDFETHEDVISYIESNEATIDGTNSATYTIDGLHFNVRVDFRYGKLGAITAVTLADGFHYTAQI